MPGRRTGGTAARRRGNRSGRTRRAARRKLVGDRAAHDAGTDDGDLHMGNSIWLSPVFGSLSPVFAWFEVPVCDRGLATEDREPI